MKFEENLNNDDNNKSYSILINYLGKNFFSFQIIDISYIKELEEKEKKYHGIKFLYKFLFN